MTDLPYELGPLIGHGGQADVHAATEPMTGAPLAVKVQHLSANRHAGPSLLREYQLLREIDHPAFAVAHAAGRLADGRVWLAMQRLDGVAAADWARGLGPPATRHRTRRVLERMVAIADAVAYLHRQGVVHGDLKPGNILVAADGSPRILDLGGVHFDPGLAPGARGMFRTVPYASPEQLDKGVLAASADVFSLAATCVRLLSDEHPFGAGAKDAVRARQGAASAASAALDRSGPLSEATRALLLRCLSVEPAARPCDAGALRDALRARLPTPVAWPTAEPRAASQAEALGTLRALLVDAPGLAPVALIGRPGGAAALLAQLALDAAALGASVLEVGGDAPERLRDALDALLEGATPTSEAPQLVVLMRRAERFPASDRRALEVRLATLVERGWRVALVAATHEAGMAHVARWLHRPTAIRLAPEASVEVDEPEAEAETNEPAWPGDAQLAAILEATALVAASPDGRADLATLASGLALTPAAVRRGLDRLARHGWVRGDADGGWALAEPELRRTLHRHGEGRAALAERLANEWEVEPHALGRANCLLVAGRVVAAADNAARWARAALRHDDVARVADGLDRLGALDDALEPGAARTSWLLLRARTAALADCTDPRVAGWLAELGARAETREAQRADELAAVVAGWRGEPPERALVLAQRELDQGRYERALALARGEVSQAHEAGALDVAARAALVAGQALAALGRLEEAARALADAADGWPDAPGAGAVAYERAEVLAALGRWGEAGRVLARAHARATTPWDRAATAIGAAARATDRGHARGALALLEALAAEPFVARHPRLQLGWHVERLRAIALHGSDDALAAARAAEPVVAELMRAGRRAHAARLGAWQAAAAWTAGDHQTPSTEASGLATWAASILGELGHRLWWAEAATVDVWLARSQGGDARMPPALVAQLTEAEAWPLAMRAALAEGDVQRAWGAAEMFLAHVDSAGAIALELMPWAVRARALTAEAAHHASLASTSSTSSTEDG
ncbi:MAG: protein kinase [Myxococcota bacterium]